MLTIRADTTAPVPRPVIIEIGCDGPSCGVVVSVTVTGTLDRQVTGVARQVAMEAGWTRRTRQPVTASDSAEAWACPRCR